MSADPQMEAFGGQATRLLAVVVGVLLFLAPLKFLAGLTPVPEYRTGTFEDLEFAVTAGATLYGGVLAGVLVLWRLEADRGRRMKGPAVFGAGWIGAMAAIGLALGAWAVLQWLTTGTVVKPGQSLALLPIFPIIGGLLSLPIAAGAGLIVAGLRRPRT
jgi:hypothetical protein